MYIHLLLALYCMSLQAATLTPTKTKITFKIPYTFGAHIASASVLTGTLQWDENNAKIISGKLTLDANDISVDDEKLKCHLLESLTLDYKKSQFPESHVCVDNKLPSEGDDAPVYPSIAVSLSAPVAMGDVTAQVQWDIHGVKIEQSIPVTLNMTEDKKAFILKGKWTMKRSDFGVIVKKFLFINAADEIPVDLIIEGDVKP